MSRFGLFYTLLAAFGLMLLIQSLREGLYTLPVLFVLGLVSFYVYAWWVRRHP